MNSKTTPLLIVLLVIVSFLLGTTWTRLRYVQKQQVVSGGKGQQIASPSPAVKAINPTEPEVLGAEDQAEIVKNPAAVKGSEEAKITIVEFSEYQCPFCKKYVDEAYTKIWTDYGDKIRYIFHDYPLEFHQHAQKVAEAARCAGDQGKYWEYHDKLFAEREKWVDQQDATETLVSFAASLGLNKGSFRECLTSGKFTQVVKDDLALGQKVGVSGTPSFFINGKKLVGAQPYEAFKAIIEEELKK